VAEQQLRRAVNALSLPGYEGAGAQRCDRAAAGGARSAECEEREPILPLQPFCIQPVESDGLSW